MKARVFQPVEDCEPVLPVERQVQIMFAAAQGVGVAVGMAHPDPPLGDAPGASNGHRVYLFAPAVLAGARYLGRIGHIADLHHNVR